MLKPKHLAIDLWVLLASITACQIALSNTDHIEQVVVIANRVATPVSQSPANVSLLDAEQLARIAPIHIQQALVRIPGVNTQRGNGQESLPAMRSPVLTGAGACGSFLVMEDNIPVRGFGFCNVNQLFDTHFEQASRIEVALGTNTAFYGSNALNGSINIVLPDSGNDSLALEVGRYEYSRLQLSKFYSGERSANGNVHITLTQDGGYRDASGYNQQKVSWRHRAALGNWQANSGLSFTRLDQETAGFITGRDSYRSEYLARRNPNPEAFRKTSNFRLWSHLSQSLSADKKLQVSPYFRYTAMDFVQHFLVGDPLEQNSQWGFGVQSSLQFQPSDDLQWFLGADAEYSQGALLQSQDNPTQGSAFLQQTIPTGVHYDYRVDAVQLALFSYVEWSIAEQWQLLASFRWELNRYHYNNLALDGRTRDDGTECGSGGCRYSRPADRDDSFNQLLPNLELHYRVSEAVQLFVALKQGFRVPQATELYRLQRDQSVADLDSVVLNSIDLGAKIAYLNSHFDIALYANQLHNVIIRDSDFFNIDGNKTTSLGLETQYQQQLSQQWQLTVTANWARHQYASDQLLGADQTININGNDVDTAPRFFGSAQLVWSAGQWLTELEWLHTGSYYLNPENSADYGGHTLLNASINYQLDDRWSILLRLTNLANRRYAERADFTNFSGYRYFPGEPLSALIKITHNW